MGLGRSDGSDGRFSRYVEGLAGVIGHADRVKPLRDYCTGLILPCARKSVEPMAAVTAPARTGAQHQSFCWPGFVVGREGIGVGVRKRAAGNGTPWPDRGLDH